MVVDALSRMTMDSVSHIDKFKKDLAKDILWLVRLGVRYEDYLDGDFFVGNNFKSSLLVEVKSKKHIDKSLREFKESVLGKFNETFTQGDCIFRCQGRLCAPNMDRLRDYILKEACGSCYSIYPGLKKMYQELRGIYWWEDLKRYIAEFIAMCPNCKHVKAKILKPGGLLQKIQIFAWKWEDINMDFVVGLHRPQRSYDSLWVVVDKLTMSAMFIPMKSTYSAEDYARIFIDEILCRYGIPLTIISDRGAQFTSRFWSSFRKGLGTKVKLSTAFHPQTDGQAEHPIQTLKDMLRVCIIYFKGNCDNIFLWWSYLIIIVFIHPFPCSLRSLVW